MLTLEFYVFQTLLQLRDCKTDFHSKNTQTSVIQSSEIVPTSINYTRGCGISEDMSMDGNGSAFESTLVTTGLEVSQITEDFGESTADPSSVDVTFSAIGQSIYAANPQAGVSLETVSLTKHIIYYYYY